MCQFEKRGFVSSTLCLLNFANFDSLVEHGPWKKLRVWTICYDNVVGTEIYLIVE